MTAPTPSIRTELAVDGSLLHIELCGSRGNIIDLAMMQAITTEMAHIAERVDPRAIVFSGAGDHFSYGASIPEHHPDRIGEMLPAFHALFRTLARSGRVLIAAVHGRCLGGGLELAALCHRVIAAPAAEFGCPEIHLAAFAPLASLLLPYRIGQPAADDLLLTGRSILAPEALALRLIDEVHADPLAAARAWHRRYLLPLSAAALPHAVGAARARLHRDLDELLPKLEHRYLNELIHTRDAREGIDAFLARRRPRWTHD